jgi:hypothetical protein
MSRYFRGPADAYPVVDVTDPGALPAACIQQRDSKLWSVAALNVGLQPRSVALQLPKVTAGLVLHKILYTYGDATSGKVSNCVLPQPAAGAAGQLTVGAAGELADALPPLTLAVYTQWL